MDRIPRAQALGDALADVLPGMVARDRVNPRQGPRLHFRHLMQNCSDVPHNAAEDDRGAVFLEGERDRHMTGNRVRHGRDQMQVTAAAWPASGKAPDGGLSEASEGNADVKFQDLCGVVLHGNVCLCWRWGGICSYYVLMRREVNMQIRHSRSLERVPPAC